MLAKNPVIYLPVESQNRELDSKLLIGATLANAGIKVVVGWQRAIVANLAYLPPGVVLFKGLNKVQRLYMEGAGAAGHVVMAVDEECFSISDPECMLKDIDPMVAVHCQRTFAPNALYQKALLENRGFRDNQIAVVGNPRADLARTPLSRMLVGEAEALRQKFGPLVLVNTNTCAVNSVWGDLNAYSKVCAEIGWLDRANPDSVKTLRDHVEHDQACFVAMLEALELLTVKLPDHNIVIRPHPSERFEPWYERFGERDRFHVIREGGNLAWIKAAELLLHTSCTTGAEAALMDRPVISLVPEGACVSHWYSCNRVNLTAGSAAEVVGLARRFLVQGEDVFEPGRVQRVDDLKVLFSLDHDGTSYQRISDEILGAFDLPVERDFHWKIDRIDVLEAPKVESNKNDFGLETINKRLDLLRRLSSEFGTLSTRRIWDELFMLESTSAAA